MATLEEMLEKQVFSFVASPVRTSKVKGAGNRMSTVSATEMEI